MHNVIELSMDDLLTLLNWKPLLHVGEDGRPTTIRLTGLSDA